MDKRIISIIAVILIAVLGALFSGSGFFSEHSDSDLSTNISSNSSLNITEEGQYCTKDEVAAYIKEYHKLPSNYITKKEAQKLGWKGGPLKEYAPGKSIGGDVFTNRQSILPIITSEYIECDIDANGTNRGAKRIVYSTSDYKVYYTADHYTTFEEI